MTSTTPILSSASYDYMDALADKIHFIQTRLRDIYLMDWEMVSKTFFDYAAIWSSSCQTTPHEHTGSNQDCEICATAKTATRVGQLSKRFQTRSLNALEALRQQIGKQMVIGTLCEKGVKGWCDYITKNLQAIFKVVEQFQFYLDTDASEYWVYVGFVSVFQNRIRSIQESILYLQDNWNGK